MNLRADFVHGNYNPFGGYLLDIMVRCVQRADPRECWDWKGDTDDHGYALYQYEYKRTVRVHRVIYEAVHYTGSPKSVEVRDPRMKGMDVDHLCGNRICINPDHLELITPQEHGRKTAERKREHELDPRIMRFWTYQSVKGTHLEVETELETFAHDGWEIVRHVPPRFPKEQCSGTVRRVVLSRDSTTAALEESRQTAANSDAT